MCWPHLSYIGVDLLKEQVEANAALVSKRGAASFGLTNATFQVGSMTMAALPTADLLLTKDTLIHLPLADINHFLDLSVRGCPARFRYVIFVQEMAQNITTNVEISRQGHHALDFAVPPFSLNVTTVFTYPSGRCCRKSVHSFLTSRAHRRVCLDSGTIRNSFSDQSYTKVGAPIAYRVSGQISPRSVLGRDPEAA